MATVLVVDDHPDVCRVISRLVRTFGHHSDSAGGGEEALEYLREHVPDLVILDAMMPKIDGLQVLQQIRRDPRTKAVPVVMFSARSDAEFMRRALKEGANDYWIKGAFGLEQLDAGLAIYLPNVGD